MARRMAWWLKVLVCVIAVLPSGAELISGSRKLLEENPDPAEEAEVAASPIIAAEPSKTFVGPGQANYDDLPLTSSQIQQLYSRHVEPAMMMAEKHLYPQLQKHSAHLDTFKTSTERLFREAHGRVTAHLTRLTGHDAELVPDWLQYSAYGMLLFPLAIWLMLLAYFFTQMAMAGIVFTLAKCGNLFWTIYCLFLAIMTFVISDEPLFFFHQNHPSEYIAFQFVKAGLYTMHLLVLLVQCVSDVSFLNVVQWVGATLIGVHYYLNAWHPAMMEEPPLLGFKYYAFYMYCFFIFFILPSSGRYMYKYRND
mmetsp:Transcript_39656/g.66555  ORF Transcript_39656/g.66555 Transcript_39656/m.66555 type:complete len:309 (-) Transcript_39656:498-1424(-)|eukprot:CAMPEP_0198199774 /NCGR_PEP_ID=MMETSP1445-20131203/2943_1 /TAXON_ID=36898 /ORGANISM="Pyramimonas sp., Strain CCMP2087" /LENGTH=308 /DNA_ID=CAMNT_0043869667 /DNA_START=221 /DNA_END=1147 /DNA_ORIENTATION=+